MEPKEGQKPPQRIPAKKAVEDIRAGMSDSDLMAKYKLTAEGLGNLFEKLISAGLVSQAERNGGAAEPAEASPSSWKCPACGTPQAHELDECPKCGIVVAKFKEPTRIPGGITRGPECPADETPSPYALASKEGERFDSRPPEPAGKTGGVSQASDLNAPLYGSEVTGAPINHQGGACTEPSRLLLKRFTTDTSLILGAIGCVLLVVGVFLPVVKLPFIGGVTLIQIGKVTGGVAGFAYFVLAMTAISVVLVLFKYYIWLWLTSLGSAAVLFYTFLQFRRGLYQAKTWIGSLLAGQVGPQFLENPQLRILKDQMQQMMVLENDWGWTILFAGSALLAAAALIATMRGLRIQLDTRRGARDRMPL